MVDCNREPRDRLDTRPAPGRPHGSDADGDQSYAPSATLSAVARAHDISSQYLFPHQKAPLWHLTYRNILPLVTAIRYERAPATNARGRHPLEIVGTVVGAGRGADPNSRGCAAAMTVAT
jgi:hypothetical protein